MKVRDLGDEYELIQQDMEVRQILSDLGLVRYANKSDTWGTVDYVCLFVKVSNGDYEEIWGCEHSVAWLDAPVYRLDLAEVP